MSELLTMTEHLDLEAAVERHVRPGDAICVALGHSRWTAAAREVARQILGNRRRFHPVHALAQLARRPLLQGRDVEEGGHRVLG